MKFCLFFFIFAFNDFKYISDGKKEVEVKKKIHS